MLRNISNFSLMLFVVLVSFKHTAIDDAAASQVTEDSETSRQIDEKPVHRHSLGNCTSTSKYHPGHYVSLTRKDTDKEVRAVALPGVRGIQKRYFWKSLEPQPGHYVFESVERDLQLAAELNLQFVLFVGDKSFNGEVPLPTHLAHPPFTLKNRNRGYTAARWHPTVIGEFSALLRAIGDRFDCHPNFEGIAIQETALSLDNTVLNANGYTPEKYRDALTGVLSAAADALPNSNIFWYMNFFPREQSYILEVARNVAAPNLIVGGPDILPDNAALRKRTYPLYSALSGEFRLFNSMQHDSYAHVNVRGGNRNGYWPLERMFEFARDQLKVNYIFWNHKTWRKPADSHNWEDAVPVIAEHPNFNVEN